MWSDLADKVIYRILFDFFLHSFFVPHCKTFVRDGAQKRKVRTHLNSLKSWEGSVYDSHLNTFLFIDASQDCQSALLVWNYHTFCVPKVHKRLVAVKFDRVQWLRVIHLVDGVNFEDSTEKHSVELTKGGLPSDHYRPLVQQHVLLHHFICFLLVCFVCTFLISLLLVIAISTQTHFSLVMAPRI